jgi:hypothetical protein
MTQEQVQELLRPRVKCIAPDTSRKYEIGDIFYKHVFPGSDSGMSCYITNLEFPLQGKNLITEFAENMPHLFQRLNWCEEINAIQIKPLKYVKWVQKSPFNNHGHDLPLSGVIEKVEEFKKYGSVFHIKVPSQIIAITGLYFLPATEAEYLAEQNKKL